MPALFISNPTHQHTNFNYRLPEEPMPRVLPIKAGQQVQFPRDLDDFTLEEVLKQLKHAGGREFNDARSIDSPFALTYRVGKRIESDAIDEARERDVAVRQDVAGDMIEAAGKSTFASALKSSENVNATSLEVVELAKEGGEEAKRGVDFEVKVSKKGGQAQRSRRRG